MLNNPFRLGAIIGGGAALIYSLLLGSPMVITMLVAGNFTDAISFMLGAFLFGLVIGFVPAMVIGGFSSEYIADQVARQQTQTFKSGARIWAATCLCMLLLASALFWGAVTILNGLAAFGDLGWLTLYGLVILGPELSYMGCAAWTTVYWMRFTTSLPTPQTAQGSTSPPGQTPA